MQRNKATFCTGVISLSSLKYQGSWTLLYPLCENARQSLEWSTG
jgi:hypothetical protein